MRQRRDLAKHRVLAIDALAPTGLGQHHAREVIGKRRLADAFGPDDQPCVMHAAAGDRVGELAARSRHVRTGDRPRAAQKILRAGRAPRAPRRVLAPPPCSWAQALEDRFPHILGHHGLGLARIDHDAAIRLLLGDIEKGPAHALMQHELLVLEAIGHGSAAPLGGARQPLFGRECRE